MSGKLSPPTVDKILRAAAEAVGALEDQLEALAEAAEELGCEASITDAFGDLIEAVGAARHRWAVDRDLVDLDSDNDDT